MADNLSNYSENKLLDHSLGKAAFTMPATVRLALYTSNPTDADSGTEVTGGSYARQPLVVDAAASGATQNDGEIVFPVATANWGTITHWGVRDATSGGNLLWYGAFTVSKAIDTNDQLRIADGDLDFGMS